MPGIGQIGEYSAGTVQQCLEPGMEPPDPKNRCFNRARPIYGACLQTRGTSAFGGALCASGDLARMLACAGDFGIFGPEGLE